MTFLGAGGIELGVQVVTLPELEEKLRKQCLHLLYKVCKACEMLPASYILQQEFTCVGNVHYYGGFADVNKGEYLGRRVAIKHLRIRTKDLSNRIFKVLKFRPTGTSSFLSSHIAVLPGNHMLEATVPSKHPAFVGGFCLHGPPAFPHRL